ncbi:MAG: hypothetical protein ACFFER_05240 [Candidatus Thorarchaeota archaeon]
MIGQDDEIDIEYEAVEKGERIASWLLVIIAVSIMAVLAYTIVGPTSAVLAQILAENSFLYPLTLLFQIILLIVWGFISFAVPGILGMRMGALFETNGRKETVQSLANKREMLFNEFSSKSLTWLDEYWEIAITSIALIVTAWALMQPGDVPLADWVQVLITLVFWASYKVAKAKQSIDLRLLSIASTIQFLIIIVTLNMLPYGISLIGSYWTSLGSSVSSDVYSLSWTGAYYVYAALVFFAIYSSNYVGKYSAKWAWKALLEAENKRIDESNIQTAMHLVDNALPSYLFYGVLWFLVVLIPSPTMFASFEYYLSLLATVAILASIVTLAWITKIWIAHADLLEAELNRFVDAILYGGWTGVLVISSVSIFALLWMSYEIVPSLIFNYIVPLNDSGIIFSSGITGAVSLMLVQAVSFSLSYDSNDDRNSSHEE